MSQTEKLTKRELEIEHIIYHDTKRKLEQDQYNEIGCDALNISIDLVIDRANVSRILNKLCRVGKLSKIQGRPALYFSKIAVENVYSNVFIPQVFPKDQSFPDFLEQYINKKPISEDIFCSIIGNKPYESLYNIIHKFKGALSYPPYGLSVLLFGEENIGKKALAKQMFRYGLSKKFFTTDNDYYYVDCHEIDDNFDLLKMIKEKCIRKKKVKMFVIDHIDALPPLEIEKLKTMLRNNYFFDLKTKKRYPLSAFFVFCTNKPYASIEESGFDAFVSIIIQIPSFNNRTIKEKILYILHYFQVESDLINRSIKITKNILNCFVMSSYSANMFDLHKEIRATLASAIQRQHHTSYVTIDFDDISDRVLTNIKEVNNSINELYYLYNLLDIKNLVLHPNTTAPIFTYLKENIRYSENLTLYDTTKAIQNDKTTNYIYHSCKEYLLSILDDEMSIMNTYSSSGVYDLLYEIIHNVISDEKLIYGLVNHLSQVVEDVLNNSYNKDYHLDKQSNKPSTYSKVSNQIIKILNSTYMTIIPKQEQKYIELYFDLANKVMNSFVSVFFICNFKTTANNYMKFANSLTYTNKAHAISMDELHTKFSTISQKLDFIENKICDANSGKGTLILVEDELYDTLNFHFADNDDIKIVSNLRIHFIDQVMQLSSNKSIFLNDFNDLIIANVDTIVKPTNFEQDIVSLVNDEILNKSLLYVNPHKASEISIKVFSEIIKELEIVYSEVLAVKFILHTSFLLERVIRGDSLTYKKINEFINIHGKELHIVEKHFFYINDQFGIIVPQSELIYITQIFIDYLPSPKNLKV